MYQISLCTGVYKTFHRIHWLWRVSCVYCWFLLNRWGGLYNLLELLSSGYSWCIKNRLSVSSGTHQHRAHWTATQMFLNETKIYCFSLDTFILTVTPFSVGVCLFWPRDAYVAPLSGLCTQVGHSAPTEHGCLVLPVPAPWHHRHTRPTPPTTRYPVSPTSTKSW